MTSRLRALATAAVIAGAAAGALLAAPAAARPDDAFTSIFTGGDFEGAGWASCPTAIVWDADVSELSARGQRNALSDLGWALATWGRASGLAVSRGESVPLRYDNTSATVTGGVPGSRKIYVKFVEDQESTYLSGRVVGVATPTSVNPTGEEIIGGSAAFRVDYVEYASKSESRTLLLHELGHALGLGHSSDRTSVMYPIVTSSTVLSSADRAGIRAFTKPCDPAFAAQRGQ